ncbi:MAG: hypothetical protein DBY41_01405 [Clostridium sp.]|nr:MAG: hypothetical protein DBY41_01405 [Clostridium sp.]
MNSPYHFLILGSSAAAAFAFALALVGAFDIFVDESPTPAEACSDSAASPTSLLVPAAASCAPSGSTALADASADFVTTAAGPRRVVSDGPSELKTISPAGGSLDWAAAVAASSAASPLPV